MFNNYYGNKKDDRCNDSCNRNKKDYGFYYGRIDDDCNHKKKMMNVIVRKINVIMY